MVLIIPYRNRYEQLSVFLRHLHPILKRQYLDYRIIVVEQVRFMSEQYLRCTCVTDFSEILAQTIKVFLTKIHVHAGYIHVKLLAKHVVKIDEYWPGSFLCLWTEVHRFAKRNEATIQSSLID